MKDIEALRDMHTLRVLDISDLQLEDLTPLATLWVDELKMNHVPFTDLHDVSMLPLKSLSIAGTGVSDLSPLASADLHFIRISPSEITHGLDVLRFMPHLEKIAIDDDVAMSAEDFWLELDRQQILPVELESLGPIEE